MEETKKLYRSRVDRVIAGVCGGLGEYFGVDPVIIRVVFLVLAVVGGSGVLVYIILIFLVPLAPGNEPFASHGDKVEEFAKEVGDRAKEIAHDFSTKQKAHEDIHRERRSKHRTVIGAFLVILGVLAFADVLLPAHLVRFELVWPVVIILVGVSIMSRGSRGRRHS
jgi:phage shock protein C